MAKAKRKNITRVANRLTNKARRMEMLAGILDDVSNDADYERRVTRAEKFYGAADRLRAKDEGKKAAVRIAKARALKIKKEPLTRNAVKLNTAASRMRKIGQQKVYIAALNSKYSTESKTGDRSRNSTTAKSKLRKLDPQNPAVQQEAILKRRAVEFETASHMVARKSGGVATAMKRNAEAGISHIARGRALKSAARSAGVMGMVMLFNKFINGSDPKKRS
jgi:hypothetical protein